MVTMLGGRNPFRRRKKGLPWMLRGAFSCPFHGLVAFGTVSYAFQVVISTRSSLLRGFD
jgi:hypothetical protein